MGRILGLRLQERGGTDNGNLVILSDCEVMEAQLRNLVKLSYCEVMEAQLRNLVKLSNCEVIEAQRKEEFVANVVPASVDDVGDQERMVLLPEEIGDKGFLESIPLRSERDSSRKRHAVGPLLGSWLEARGRNVLWMCNLTDIELLTKFAERQNLNTSPNITIFLKSENGFQNGNPLKLKERVES
ncbi:hypothetical protein TNCV_125141 [Trichonephila clavipes]|nr:hypothetical protein TNCV_125141 [Trichonephila clavipes]